MDSPSSTPSYLDMQAQIGITKHNGGYPATDRLLELCRVAHGSHVLYVGSGIGVGPSYLARTRRCHVVAGDISPKMLRRCGCIRLTRGWVITAGRSPRWGLRTRSGAAPTGGCTGRPATGTCSASRGR